MTISTTANTEIKKTELELILVFLTRMIEITEPIMPRKQTTAVAYTDSPAYNASQYDRDSAIIILHFHTYPDFDHTNIMALCFMVPFSERYENIQSEI